jgi:excisionase family DNA binding protein
MRKRKDGNSHNGEKLLLSIAEVAVVLGVSRAQVYVYIQKEGLPTVKIGKGDQKVYKSSLELWIRQHEICSTS